MKKKLKISLFMLGAIILFLIIQYEFLENDSWNAWNLPLTGKIILIDPGHGGPDGGAGDSTVLEKDIALKVSLMVRDYIQQQGALVIMTRETDKDLAKDGTRGLSRRKTEDLHKRLEMINESEADLFISLHLNSIPSPRWRGAQTFFAPHFKENEKLAKFIQVELRRNLENTKRVAKPINNVFILKNAKKPGALVEIGFLSNEAEKQLLQDEEYQRKVAASIYEGIIRYFTNEKELTE
ncbi:N-acetylmuramoyl-L-alanine amidase CwlD [Bacillus aquiflavi]|uniref:N-acetylmuramoyl-L-alanine amidase CwlD n=1 Tax=Bacillus aquiflavi TaxID=2672567 RepID=A0A6B3W2V7_9BACI|nr:N-acetylmuramoyl-L-alanine amidase CwlD [Bacillus aquiflavi]MBA4538715.1 N-acetylmuramoyl-L-alanine amidase CwlD [Bacillus aquiflavi]NEY83075.1 N-acetylmuramoyl-L-alanine amidase CwlD [Bacillus aquiflavi]UAC48332.1 N-acetylmuramoyl-L-alanine amidase CwlD [Bacillus aquiflavi]